MGKRVDSLTNALRSVVEALMPGYDGEAEARDRERTGNVIGTARRVRRRASLVLNAEDVVASYRRADGTYRR